MRKNTAVLTDSLLQLGIADTTQQDFYSIERSTVDYMNETPNGSMVEIVLHMDQQEDTYERRVYSLLDMSGSIGGLYGIFEVVGVFVVGYFSDKLLRFSMLSRLYQVEANKEDQQTMKVNPKTKKLGIGAKTAEVTELNIIRGKAFDSMMQKQAN